MQTKRGWKPELDVNKVPNEYHAALYESMLDKRPDSISEVEQIVRSAAHACDRSRAHKHNNQQENSSLTPPWTRCSFQELLDERRSATCKHERKALSKQIRRIIRSYQRARRNLYTETVLAEFQDLNRLLPDRVDSHKPLNHVADAPSPEELTNFLESVFRSNLPPEKISPGTGFDIPPFTLDEIRKAVGKLKHRRCPDPCGIVAEMFRFANDEILVCIMDIFNRMIHTGVLESNWQSIFFHHVVQIG